MQLLKRFLHKHLKQTFYFIAALSVFSLLLSTTILVIVSRNYSQAVNDGSKLSTTVSQIIDMRTVTENITSTLRDTSLSADKKNSEYLLAKEMIEAMFTSLRDLVNSQKDAMEQLAVAQLSVHFEAFSAAAPANKLAQAIAFTDAIEHLQDHLIIQLKAALIKEKASSERLENFVLTAGMLVIILIVITSVLAKGVLSRILQQQETIIDQQAKLVAQSNLAILGQMAGGVAHEINTPLGAIVMRSAQLETMLGADDFDRELFLKFNSSIVTYSHRIEKIVNSLKMFCQDGEDEPYHLCTVDAILSIVMDICHEKCTANGIALSISEFDKSLSLECRQVQISQVMINLINNSFDAVAPLAEKWLRIDVADRGNEIEIAVVDSGKGIPEAIQDQIIKPFFTTKPIGSGTGLGLSISHGIAQDHLGSLSLDTHSPHTRFVLLLPKKRSSLAV